MSDELTQPATAGGGSIGPDGTPFDSARWDSYVQHTKAEKAELRQALDEANGVWEDEQTALARFKERFPHLIAEDDDTPEPEYDEDDDPRFQKLTELEKRQQAQDEWIAQQKAVQAEAEFNREVAVEAGDRKLGKQAKDWILQETIRLGNGRENLAKATKAWLEFEDELRGPQRKPAPSPPQPGKAAEIDRNASKDPEERRRARRARIAAQVEAGMQQ